MIINFANILIEDFPFLGAIIGTFCSAVYLLYHKKASNAFEAGALFLAGYGLTSIGLKIIYVGIYSSSWIVKLEDYKVTGYDKVNLCFGGVLIASIFLYVILRALNKDKV